MVSQNKEEHNRVRDQVREILTDSSCKIMWVLAKYYDKAVDDEHNVFIAFNKELAALELTVEESEDVDACDEKSTLIKTSLGPNWKTEEWLRSKNC